MEKNDHHSHEAEFPWKENPTTTTTLSDLPDEILRAILSTLPFQEVAQTMLLSRTWRDIWNRIAVIHESGSLTDMDKALSRFLDRVFDSGNSFHYQRKLEFHSPGGHKLIVAMGLQKNLHLEYLPYSSSNSIPRSVLFKAKSAYVRSIRLTRLGNLFDHVVSWLQCEIFPFLESIEFRKCEGMSDLWVGPNRWSKLKRLSIIDCAVDSIEIRSDRLASFRFRGRRPRMEICTYIKDVMLDFREGPLNTFSENFSKVAFVERTERITLCGWTFEAMLRRHLDSFKGFKCLKELWWIDNSMGEEEIDSLITFLKDCPALEKLFVTIDPSCYGVPQNGGRRKALWKERERLRHLMMVKMDFSGNEEDMVHLADRILSISEDEPEVVATTRTSSIVRRLVRVGPNRPRLFVEKGVGEMSSEMLNSRHAHMSELLGDRQV